MNCFECKFESYLSLSIYNDNTTTTTTTTRSLKNMERVALEEKKVRSQRSPLLEHYKLKTKTLKGLRREHLVPSALKMLNLKDKEIDLTKLLDVKCEYPGVYSFDLFRPGVCKDLISEINQFLTFRNEIEKAKGPIPGTLRERLVLKDMLLGPFSNELFQKIVVPLSKQLFDKHVSDLDFEHSYFVGYAPTETPAKNLIRNALIPHSDDSEITLNLCLSKDYTGGELHFHGALSKADFRASPKIDYTYKHQLGRCVLHLGKMIHSVSSVTKGERHVLIMWCRSIRNQRAIQCPCCREFNRKECVCVPELFGGAY